MIGISQATISNIERGERRLDVIELLEWLEALEEDVSAFLKNLEAEYRMLRIRGVSRDRSTSREDRSKTRS